MARQSILAVLGAAVFATIVGCSHGNSSPTEPAPTSPPGDPGADLTADEPNPPPITVKGVPWPGVPMPRTKIEAPPAFLSKDQERNYYADQLEKEVSKAASYDGRAKQTQEAMSRLDPRKLGPAIEIAKSRAFELGERARIHRVRAAQYDALFKETL